MNRLKTILFALSYLVTLFAGISFAQNDNDDITLGKYRKFHSQVLGEDRTIFVHLPRDYESSTVSYPVIYLLYCNAVDLYYASSVATLHPLQDAGKTPEFILIGVGDTGHRYRDYLPVPHQNGPGQADNFVKFFKEELIPFVDKNYRTKDYRILVGPQSSSVFGVYSFLKYPELFDAAIVSNPFNPYYRSAETLIGLAQINLKDLKPSNKLLFISYYDGEKESLSNIEHFVKLITSQKPEKFRFNTNLSKDDNFYEDVFLKEALLYLFNKFEIPQDLEVQNLADLQNFYHKVSEYYGYQVNIPSLIITFKVENLIRQGKFVSASEILDYALKINPKDTNSLFRKAMLMTSLGDLETAIVYYEKMQAILPNEDIVKNRLQAAKKQIAGSAAYRVEKAINTNGIEQGQKTFDDINKQKPEGIYFDEREFNTLGYRYISRGMMDAALEIFKMNIELYPESANAYDSLAEIYMTRGNKELAMKYYKKSLELNPQNENAVKKLKELN